jgi:hypothetical protein
MDKRNTAPLRRESPAPDLSHHERHCVICHHPEREDIEEAFLNWRETSSIRHDFDIPSRTTIYRHARACGLFEGRARNIRAALELIIEGADCVQPKAEAIIKAIRAYTKINSAGEWIEPPAHVVVSSGGALAARPAPALRGSPENTFDSAPDAPALASTSPDPCATLVQPQEDEPSTLVPAACPDAGTEQAAP